MVHAREQGQARNECNSFVRQARQIVEGSWNKPSQRGLLIADGNELAVLARRVRSLACTGDSAVTAQARMLHTDIPHDSLPPDVHLGVAGWAIRREHSPRFANVGTHLQRYATLFNAVEINSCFYRPHRRSTYERWAASVPDNFRFSVKLPKVITHELRLVGGEQRLDDFLKETSGLGDKRGPILIQLPPSFAFDLTVVRSFLDQLRYRFDGDAVIEPRHESWFIDEVEMLLRENRVARVAADPARVLAAAVPGGYDQPAYIRLHGSPRVYYSAYTPEVLESVADSIQANVSRGIRTWCIFDNTALGFATGDALTVQALLARKVTSLQNVPLS